MWHGKGVHHGKGVEHGKGVPLCLQEGEQHLVVELAREQDELLHVAADLHDLAQVLLDTLALLLRVESGEGRHVGRRGGQQVCSAFWPVSIDSKLPLEIVDGQQFVPYCYMLQEGCKN